MCFLGFVLCACHLDFEDNNTIYDIFIIAGQSNTHQGRGLDHNIDTPDSNIFQLGRFSLYNHVIGIAQEPLQHHTSDDQRIGFGLTFCKLYNQNINLENNRVLIIPCGYGGTSISDWSSNNKLYKDLVNRVNFVLKKYPESKVKAVLWHQGESDVNNQNYAPKLDTFILQIQKDLGGNTPFILGGMVPYWAALKPTHVAQQNIIKSTPERIPNTAYANPDIPLYYRKRRQYI